MATTLFLPSSSSAPAISPTPSSGWDVTGGLDRLIMGTSKTNTGMTSKTIAITNVASNATLFRQYIYGPLQAVTIAANVVWTLYIRSLEASTSLNAFPGTGLWVATSTGSLRGTIRAGGTSGTGAEFTTSLSSRPHQQSPQTSSSISVQDGDYLVLEVGCIQGGTTTAANASMNFGDDSATNITAANDTAANNPVLVIATDFLIYNPNITATVSLGTMTLTGVAAVAIREEEGASIALGTETLTGLAMTGASAQARATVDLGSISLTGIAAIAGYTAGATLSVGTETLTGIAATAAASISALLTNTTELVIEGTDLTAVVADESGDYSVLINRGTITNTGIAMTVQKSDVAAMTTAILNLAGADAIARQSANATASVGTTTLTGVSMSATEQEVGTMTRGVLTLTGVDMLAKAAVLAAMGHGTLTLTGTATQGRLGFKFSQFSVI